MPISWGGKRGVRRIGKCIYVRKLAGRFKNRAGVLGSLALGDELLLFNAENVHGAYDTDDQEGQLIRNVCRVLIEGLSSTRLSANVPSASSRQ